MSRRFHLPVVDRRFVLRGTAAALLASLAGCGVEPNSDADAAVPSDATKGFEACGTELCLPLVDPANSPLRDIGGARVIELTDGKRLLVARIDAMTFIALSAVCTHQGCIVRYDTARRDVACPCHGSRFALSGAVTNGPAERPLAKH